jgi:peptidyl-prolyl cis-trans isomerase D
MLNKFRASGASTTAWILMGLIVIGLTGFGLGGAVSGLTTQNVAVVGDEPVSRVQFQRSLDAQLSRIAQQYGRNLTDQEVVMLGIDRQVLSQQIATAAITGEVHKLGISAGDMNVRDELVSLPQFHDVTGKFDPVTYRQSLDRYGMTVSDFEETVRDELARNLLVSGISGGVDMPETMPRTVLDHYLEKRSFTWTRLGADQLAEPIAEPTEEEIQAYYEEHPDDFQSLETRRVTYVSLLPSALATEMEVTEEELQDAYDARAAQYQRPERRIVDRIAFRSAEQAEDAKARIDANEATFEEIATERGLTDSDYQLGGIEAATLDASFRNEIFGTDQLGIFGPFDSSLGPAIYRVNAIIPALTTPLENVADTLRAEVAEEKAAARIGEEIEPIEDLLAGGATLEEIADETPMELGTAGITAQNDGTDLVTTDATFREKVMAATEGDYPELFDLENGGIAAIRLDGIDAPALLPLEDVREDLVAQMKTDRLRDALVALGDEIMAEVSEGRTVTSIVQERGLTLNTHAPVTRDDPLDDMPAGLAEALFGGEKGAIVRADAFDNVVLAKIDNVIPFDPAEDDGQAQLDAIRAELANQAAADLVNAYAQALQDREGVTINQQLLNQLFEPR